MEKNRTTDASLRLMFIHIQSVALVSFFSCLQTLLFIEMKLGGEGMNMNIYKNSLSSLKLCSITDQTYL